jgi:peptidoglycan/LPS O-acetylase OafA/YrhL
MAASRPGAVLTKSPFPGFDGLRLTAAVSVLFSHGFLIAEGTENREPLAYLLGPGNILGLYGIFTFFIISGFLLSRSLSNDPRTVQFATNRFLRIMPGFVFCTLTITLIIGAFVTPQSLRSYYLQPETYGYIVSSIKCLCDSSENPFQFTTHPNLAGVRNGSLWSLSYEVLSYLFLVCLWTLLRKPWLVALAFAATAIATTVSPPISKMIPGIAYTLPFFSGGVIMYVVHQRFGTNARLAWLSLGLIGAGALVGVQHYVFTLFGAYIVVFLAERPNPGSRFAHRWGDLSYGAFLFGWPVAQLVEQLTGSRSGWQLFAYSLPAVLVCAFISWWAVEKQFLDLKGLVIRRLSDLKLASPAFVGKNSD